MSRKFDARKIRQAVVQHMEDHPFDKTFHGAKDPEGIAVWAAHLQWQLDNASEARPVLLSAFEECKLCHKKDGVLVFDWESDSYFHAECVARQAEKSNA